MCKVLWNSERNNGTTVLYFFLPGDLEPWKHGEVETWRQWDMDMETWSHADMDTWRHGHMETWTHGDMETWTWRHEHGDMGMKTWMWRHGIKILGDSTFFYLNLLGNRNRKPSRQFFLIRLPFAHHANGNLPFVLWLAKKQTESIRSQTNQKDLPICSMNIGSSAQRRFNTLALSFHGF